MISKKNQKERILYLTIILIGLLLNVIIFNQNGDQNNYINNENYKENYDTIYQEKEPNPLGTVEIPNTKEWLDNGNFTAGTDPWYNTTEGDDTDVNAQYDSGEAHFDILGSEKTFTYIADPLNDTDWTEVPNPLLPNMTTNHEFRSEGIYVDHLWQDQTGVHSPSVHWERNFSVAEDMSDYTITNATINLLVNATVGMDLDRYGDNEARDSYLGAMNTIGIGDNIRFYLIISDLDKTRKHDIVDLVPDLGTGEPGPPGNHPTDTLPDTLITMESEQDLIYYLTNVLESDNHNFTITLGIELHIEDNSAGNFDEDTFDEIYLKYFNISFTYQKKIDQNTGLSWNQIGNEIPSGDNVEITDAELKFDYYINETWPSILSPNSEIRIEINGTEHSESIGLDTVELTSQEANFDVTNIVKFAGKGVNITLSIILYLADEFELDKIIRISVDNVSLRITYSIIIQETPTEIDLFLNNINKTLYSIDVAWRETVNITVTFKNKTSGNPILGAEVDLNGTGISEVLSPSGTGNYSVVINSTDLTYGVPNHLTLHAEKLFFISFTTTIEITVDPRPTSIENVKLNQDPVTSKQMQYNELLNITLSYNDTLNTGKFISGATVAVNGSGISEPLAENSQKEYYTIVVNTVDMDVGIKILTVTAEKDNYTLSTQDITITVSLKNTYLEVLINNTPTTDFSFYNISIGAVLNFSVKFKEQITHAFIDNANVSFIESVKVIDMPEDIFFEQYNLTINTTVLGSGVKFITFTAEKSNYTSSLVQTALIIQEKASEIQLFLNGTPTVDNEKIEVQIYDTINVSVTFKDKGSGAHLSKAGGANVKFAGGDNFTENIALKHYNFTLSALDLSEGITILTVIAETPNYISSSIQFIVEVTKQLTNLTMWFNSEEVTLDPSIELPIGSQLNLTVNFTDSSGIHISAADIELGVGYIANLTEGFNLYSVIIDTNLLDLGVNIISFTAYRENFEIQTENLRLLIRRIRTKIDTDDGEDTIEIRPGESITIKIEIENLDFGGKIKGADVTYDSKLGDGDLDEEDDGVYEFTLEDLPEGTYTIEITVFKEGGQYEFDDFEITIIVKRPAEENLLFLILFIVAVIVSVSLAGYLIAYQRILKYPKPVRKVRKYRRTLKKKNAPSVDITGREKAFKSVYSDFISTNLKKGKTSTEIAQSDNMVKKSLKSSIGVVTKKPVEK